MPAEALSTAERAPSSVGGTFARNSAANAGGMIVGAIIAFILPPYLVHHLPVQTYGAWVLILNLSAYVGFLDFGVLTAVSKYIAEHNATGDSLASSRSASTGLLILSSAGLLGVFITLGLAFAVPQMFRNMPSTLYHDVRISIVIVGIALSVNLVSAIFPAIFLGLQRYQVPAAISILSRTLYAIVLLSAVARHASLITMAAAVSAVYLLTAVLQVVVWKALANHIRLSIFPIDTQQLRQMFAYCFVLTVWSVCMLFISGVDLTIVGHYAFNQVAFYSIATSPTNFMLIVIGALLGPLLPTASALSTERSYTQMGDFLLKTTRYATVLILLSGLPLLVGGFLILKLWVGPVYAANSVVLLRILLLANMVRQLCGPYSMMVVATAKQRFATASGITEAIVNLAASILLARHYGAIGVAYGTLIGAVAGVAMHFGVSMHYTQNIALSRLRLGIQGLLRPATLALPSAILTPLWLLAGRPRMPLYAWFLWAVTTLLLAAYVSLNTEDRRTLASAVKRKSRLA